MPYSFEKPLKLLGQYFYLRNEGKIKVHYFGRLRPVHPETKLYLCYPYKSGGHKKIRINYLPSPAYSLWEFQADLSALFGEVTASNQVEIELDSLTKRQWDLLSFTSCKTRLDFMQAKNEYSQGRKKPFLILIIDIETSYSADPYFYELLKEEHESDIYPTISKEFETYPFTIQVKIFKDPMPVKISYWIKDEHKALFDWFSELEKTHTLLFVAHNGSYDFVQLRKVYALYESRLFLKFDDDGTMLSGESTGRHKHYFFCTYFLTKQGLEEASGSEKVFFPYGIFRPVIDWERKIVVCSTIENEEVKSYPLEQLERYAAKDVLDCEKILKAIEERALVYETEFNIPTREKRPFSLIPYICKSTAGMGNLYLLSYIAEVFKCTQKEAKKGVFEPLFRYSIDREEYKRRERGIHAGFCFFNSQKRSWKAPNGFKIFSVDIASSYPFIMSQGLPVGYFISEEEMEEKNKTTFIKWVLLRSRAPKHYKEGRKKIKIYPKTKEEFSYISNSNWLHSELFDKEGIEFYLTESYLKILERVLENLLTDFLEVVGYFFQRRDFLVGECITTKLYKNKLAIDEELETCTDPIRRAELKVSRKAYKVWMNSIYGRLIQKTPEKEKYYLNGDFLKRPTDRVEYKNLSAGCYIAMEGRTRLLKQLLELHDNPSITLLSGDTDSLTFMAPEETDLTKTLDFYDPVNTHVLGTWTLKGIYEEAYFFGVQKKYIFINKTTDKMDKAFGGLKRIPELLDSLWANNKARFYDLLELLVTKTSELGFVNSKTRSCLAKENKEVVIWSQPVGISSRRGVREVWNKKYPIRIKIAEDNRDFKIISAD